MSKPVIVSLEGNIGSGKSTLLENMRKTFSEQKNWVFLQEPVDIWAEIKDSVGETMLSKFYKNPSKYAFAFQIMAYATRLHMLKKLIKENPECTLVICERSLEADKNIFAKMLHDDGTMEDVMYQIYEKFFAEYEEMFTLSSVIYIRADPEMCHSRITKRSREGESNIPLEYLKRCDEYHEAWLGSNDKINVFKINANLTATFEDGNPDDPGNQWIAAIQSELLLRGNPSVFRIQQSWIPAPCPLPFFG
jgi:deoxyadenosine/deoxycytidine kinase